jgi:hypothetical protein
MAGTCILVNRKWRHSFVASNEVLTVMPYQQAQGVCKNVHHLRSADDDDDDAMNLVSDTTKENQSYKVPHVNPLKRHKGISHDGIYNERKQDGFLLSSDGRRRRRT